MRDVAPGVPRARGPERHPLGATSRTCRRPRSSARAHCGGHDGPVVMYLGRLSHKKGLDVLIRAFAIARRDVPDARLAIVGPDDEGLTPALRGAGTARGRGETP